MLKESVHEIELGNFQQAIDYLQEAQQLESQLIHIGGKLYSCLAYSFAKIGDVTQAKEYILRHEDEFGDFGFRDDDEEKYLVWACEAIDQKISEAPVKRTAVLRPRLII